MENTFYTPEEVAKALRVSYRTILTLIKEKKIEAYKIGNQYRIDKNELDKLKVTATENNSN